MLAIFRFTALSQIRSNQILPASFISSSISTPLKNLPFTWISSHFGSMSYHSSTKLALKDSHHNETVESHAQVLFSSEVYEARKKAVELYNTKTSKRYPAFEFGLDQNIVSSFESLRSKYGYLKNGEELSDLTFNQEIVIYGRVTNKRQSGKWIAFYTIERAGESIQLVVAKDSFRSLSISSEAISSSIAEDFAFINSEVIKRGDIIAARGVPYRTGAGELSIRVRSFELISPCMHNIPLSGTLTDKESRYRHRYIDLLSNPDIHRIFKARSALIKCLRNFLDARGFLEVETPMLSLHSGGAAARPFSTHMLSQHTDLYLRIAPELYLKQLIVGGMDKIYEIGKSFRNEGIDSTHNPEFTTCEFYQAYANYEDLMKVTEDFLKEACFEANKILRPELIGMEDQFSVTIDIPQKEHLPPLPGTKIDFSKPFRRINLVEEVARCLRQVEPSMTELPDVNIAENASKFESILKKLNLTCSEPRTTVKMFDVLVEHFVEPQCVQPTFLCNFPLATSPLAREHRSIPGSTERFELFVARFELANSYTELNDPMEQRKRFQNQMPDGESVKTNENWYCGSLEWGLPPTAGWGMGIDRLAMVLTNNFSIKEVLLFPHMKPDIQSQNRPQL